MEPITALLLGAGNRGTVYGTYATGHKEEIRFVAVAEPDPVRRAKFAETHGIPAAQCYADWRQALAAEKMADCVFVCTQDNDHFDPAMQALEKGYHLMLEKPIACTAAQCKAIHQKSLEMHRKVCVCHVLRHTLFYSRVKQILDSGVLGQITDMLLRENVGHIHMSHSYVRGNWRRAADSNPMLLAKCCHDLDLMLWFAESPCKSVSSFGDQTYFHAQNAPAGAPQYCLEGCPQSHSCPYYAPRVYTPNGWLSHVLPNPQDKESILQALRVSPYGRCVYRCDNTVVDHQSVQMQFADGMNATLIMSGLTARTDREIYMLGTKGELRGIFGKEQYITVTDYISSTETRYDIPHYSGADDSHGGGDTGLMRDFVRLLRDPEYANTSDISVSIESHLLGYAAEKARETNSVVDFAAFCGR